MKKPKFLQSSKDLLSRSFNSAKCKTSLKLAGARVKLFRNKKDGQVKQMRRELAQLLESGDDRTARIRVEHVIREEKMMAAYDLIEIYCELIVARLPIIESQKTCPIDLKEAIASVAFASPRCGDVPELSDARKHFTAKYGKEFTEAAIELRPACGVSHLLVEKLSAVAPDVQTKLKVLQEIAEEHNVKWDSFEEKNAVASDLMKGPSTPGKEKELLVEPFHYGSLHVQTPSSNYRSGSQLNIPEKVVARQTSAVGTTYLPRESPTALGYERSQLFHGDREQWDMQFKDATSAAQAAAEAAEQASMAARAAALLSARESIARQHSSGSNKSDGYDSKLTSGQVSRKNSLEGEDSRGESSTKNPYEVGNANGWPKKSENIREDRIGKQPNIYASRSHSSVSDDVNNFFNSENRNSRYDASLVFDRGDSDSDNHGFDVGPSYDEHESELHSPSPSQKYSWTPRSSSGKTVNPTPFFTRKNSSTDDSEKSTSLNSSDKFMPVIFHDSDGPASGSDEDRGTNQWKNSNADLSSADEPTWRSKKSPTESNESSKKSSPESGGGLNLGNLTGGFRHKGYNHPTYLKNRLDESSSLKEKTKETTRPTIPPAVESPRRSTMLDPKKSSRKPELNSDSDSDRSEEGDSLRKASGHEQELHMLHGKDVQKKLSLRAPNSMFGSDCDLNDNVPQESPSRKSPLQKGISRRTKASPTGSEPKLQVRSEVLHSESQNRNSSQWETSDQLTSPRMASRPAKSDFWGLPEQPTSSYAKTFSNEAESTKKASHVHPKLPDFDTFVQSFQRKSS